MKHMAAQMLMTALLLIPFSSVAQQLSHDTLARRAALTLNTTPDNVRIFNRQVDPNDILRINFMAEMRVRDRETFQCYIVNIPGKVSDARCVDKEGTMKGVRCDSMSKAMGRCGSR